MKKSLFCNLFLAPAFILYTGFIVLSIAFSIYYSTLNWSGFGEGIFAGFDNFIDLFQDQNFWQCATNTTIFVIVAVVAQNIVGLFLAYMISQIKIGYKFFRAALFVPVVITAVAVASMFMLIFSVNGPLNYLLNILGLQNVTKAWLSDPNTVLGCVIFSETFQYIGLYFIMILTGMLSLPGDVIESAKIDGANRLQVLFRIMVPMLSEVMQVSVLYALINALKSFVHPWVMTNGGPGYTSSYISIFMYMKLFQDYKYGFGSAVAVVVLLVLLIILIIFKSFFNARENSNRKVPA